MKKILIADDSSFSRITIKKMLNKKYNAEVIEASNGLEAINLYKKEKPCIVTMDIMMPECDGIEALKEIIKFDNNANVIMCSEAGQTNKVIQSSVIGAKSFLLKPISADNFYSIIDSMLSVDNNEGIKFDHKVIQELHSIDNIIESKNETYSIRLNDNSLVDAGFLKNDLLLIENNTKPKKGHLISASSNNKYVFGYLHFSEDNKIFLTFANSNYKPIFIDKKDINGVVTASVRTLNREM